MRGFNQWLGAGRVVMRGQRGIPIIAPNADGDDAAEHVVKRVYVFDVSQTQELPKATRRAA